MAKSVVNLGLALEHLEVVSVLLLVHDLYDTLLVLSLTAHRAAES